jgi:hypothetical protein
MKRILAVLSIMGLTFSVSAQELQEIYKSGSVKLVPDTEYAQGNDWDQIFRSYNDTLYKKHIGNRKSLVILDDGSVVVSHAYQNYYSLFNPSGMFIKEFNVFRSNGDTYNKTQGVKGVLDGDIIYTGLDNMGNMLCFDRDGNHKKTLKLDYMSRQMIPLHNGKIAVVGWVIWKTKFRDFVAIVDYETNDQKVIWEHFTDRNNPVGKDVRFHYSFRTEPRGISSFNTLLVGRSAIGISFPPKIASLDNYIIVAVPNTGEILIYDLEGNRVSREMADWKSGNISVEEQMKTQSQSIEKFKAMSSQNENFKIPNEEKEKVLAKMQDDLERITDPIPLPKFSTVLKDSDGNLLFFEFPEEGGANKFNVWVYKESGGFVCQSSFECEDFNLELIPSKMVFHEGYIYAIQVLKESEGIPMRLVRFKITTS